MQRLLCICAIPCWLCSSQTIPQTPTISTVHMSWTEIPNPHAYERAHERYLKAKKTEKIMKINQAPTGKIGPVCTLVLVDSNQSNVGPVFGFIFPLGGHVMQAYCCEECTSWDTKHFDLEAFMQVCRKCISAIDHAVEVCDLMCRPTYIFKSHWWGRLSMACLPCQDAAAAVHTPAPIAWESQHYHRWQECKFTF